MLWGPLLLIMNTFIILLCVFTKQVTSQTNDIFPARILAHQKTISENSDLHVTCSTFGFKKDIMVYVYLCKDGRGISGLLQKQDQADTIFSVYRVGRHHSGNYSCVYSKREYNSSKVVMRGHNIIQILVICKYLYAYEVLCHCHFLPLNFCLRHAANFLPADISTIGPSTVSKGDVVEFRCTFSDTLQTLGECQLIQSYLRKNETIFQVQAFNVTQMEATFTIIDAVMRDSGHYSCVVLPTKCIQENEKKLYGNNVVLLEVKVSLFTRLIVSCGVLILILSVALCLWWIKNKYGHSPLCGLCAASHQSTTDMLEEQWQQTEGEDEEAQERDVFSMEEEEGYENHLDYEDSTYSDDDEGEGLYSVVRK
ncbi:uncharacterized protein LOC113122663 [Mastacembelus armatus]|uniref:uncharacterized protein LOC113122663 n=1 Tax=Mastacembelus armatus TaxID=205130 RepID=UPI000E465E70|nr:uncharacterized protein LOC113122663 [Mastacembelus armatus]